MLQRIDTQFGIPGGFLTAIEIRTEHAEMTVITEMGPRIISLRRKKGKQLMFHNPVTEPDYPETGWRAMGGGRVWVNGGNVFDEDVRAYAQDNGSCEVTISDDGNVMTVWGEMDQRFAIRRGLQIRENAHQGFDVTYLLKNCSKGGMGLSGGLWAIAAVNFGEPGSTTLGILTGNPGSNWQVGKYQIVWHWAGHHTEPGFIKEQLLIEDGLVRVTPRGSEGKLMANSPSGTIIVQNDDTSFLKVVKHNPMLDSLLPGGCNTAIYTCGKFAESETMGATAFVEADKVLYHTERWSLHEPIGWDVEGLNDIARRIMSDGIPA